MSVTRKDFEALAQIVFDAASAGGTVGQREWLARRLAKFCIGAGTEWFNAGEFYRACGLPWLTSAGQPPTGEKSDAAGGE